MYHFTSFKINIWPQSSQLAEPLWMDSGLKSGIGMHQLISTSHTHTHTKKKKTQAGTHWSNLPTKGGKSRLLRWQFFVTHDDVCVPSTQVHLLYTLIGTGVPPPPPATPASYPLEGERQVKKHHGLYQ